MPGRRRNISKVEVPKIPSFNKIDKENYTEASQLIESKFLLKCPADFYDLYDFCCSISSDFPLDVLFRSLNVRLVGPFEVLHDPLKFNFDDDLTDCYRYFHDPPELVTVLAADGDNPFHIGYFRDDYDEQPILLASSSPSETGKLTILDDNIFSLVFHLLNENLCKASTPILSKMTTFAQARGICITSKALIKRKPTCLTMNGVGFKVELRNGIGYRPLPSSHDQLTNILQNVTEGKKATDLDELMTLVQFATDEGDYGEGLELGLDLLAFHPIGKTTLEALEKANLLNRRIAYLLSTGYDLAGRPKFAQLVQRHMKNRSSTRRLRIAQ